MEIQTRLRRHNKFISAENITIHSASSDEVYMLLSSRRVANVELEFVFRR